MKNFNSQISKWIYRILDLKGESLDAEELIAVIEATPSIDTGYFSSASTSITITPTTETWLYGYTLSGLNSAATTCSTLTVSFTPKGSAVINARYYLVPSVANRFSETVIFPKPVLLASGSTLLLGADAASAGHAITFFTNKV